MMTGTALIDAINREKVGHGELCFWWIGQHSFVVKTERSVIYLDPFLAPLEGRRVPPLLAPEQVTNADIVTGSHDHADHIDRDALPALMKASPGAVLVVPNPCVPAVEAMGLDKSRVRFLQADQRIVEKGVTITGIKASHEFFDFDPKLGFPYLGYVLEADGVAVYHSGDTCVYDGLSTRLKAWSLTAAFLPINGRDGKRLRSNCIGNMTYQEAVDLAGSIRPVLTVPGHYEMFAGNTEDPALFADYMDAKYPGLGYWIGGHGEAVRVKRG
jgi:L-ascorbate metabolism protein UlaG (beta-lactamase superfamily)